jgi:hypothetical protein
MGMASCRLRRQRMGAQPRHRAVGLVQEQGSSTTSPNLGAAMAAVSARLWTQPLPIPNLSSSSRTARHCGSLGHDACSRARPCHRMGTVIGSGRWRQARRRSLSGGAANGFDVVAVGVTHEGAVRARVVLGPDAWFMERFGINAGRCLEECPHGSPVGCHERCMRLADPSPVVRGPIQNSGLGGTHRSR